MYVFRIRTFPLFKLYIFPDIRRSPLLSCIRPQETHTAASPSSPFLQNKKENNNQENTLCNKSKILLWIQMYPALLRLVWSLNGINFEAGKYTAGGRWVLRICAEFHKVTALKVPFKESFYTQQQLIFLCLWLTQKPILPQLGKYNCWMRMLQNIQALNCWKLWNDTT